MKINSVGVVGAGQMGSGIAQVLATYGIQVFLFDIEKTQTQKALQNIEKSLLKLIEKGKVKETAPVILGRIKATTDLMDFKTVNLVIEAASENKTIKQDLFKKLDEIVTADALLGSNTSSISITELASVTRRPDKFIGIHFMNPVPLMNLVEVISGDRTSSATLESVKNLVTLIEKQMISSKDRPGFILNRILMPMINEAITALHEGVGTKEDIDKGMKLGAHHPMGPLELADFIGLDTCLAIIQVLHEGFKNPKYAPSPMLSDYVKSGFLGKKTGKGFYDYAAK